MKDNRKYFFVGARPYGLIKMFELGLDIVCFAPVKDSFAEKELINRNKKYVSIESKKQLLELIKNTEFDVLVSNGCPYILPITKLRKKDEIYINLHPSLLPDLRGIHPVNGAILFDRAQGATCHYMDDGIDTGKIISQIKVVDRPDLPLDLLYQLSFMAEADAFVKAYERDFKPLGINQDLSNTIYYTRKDEDMIINGTDSIEKIIKKTKAFQIEGQYARIVNDNTTYLVKEVIEFENDYLDTHNYNDNSIIRIYHDNVIVKKDDKYLLFRLDNVKNLKVGEPLFK